MKNLKKKKKAGLSIFSEVFLHEVVDMTLSVTKNNTQKFVVRGLLIDHDENHYYVGDVDEGIRVAVAKNKVLVIELHDDTEILEGLSNTDDKGSH